MIFVIDDDEIMARCVAQAIDKKTQIFADVYTAMAAIADGVLPEMIFLDILLDGADGFTFLNELVSYTDTAKIPVVIISSLDFSNKDLSMYGVVGVLDKSKMLPKDIKSYVEQYT